MVNNSCSIIRMEVEGQTVVFVDGGAGEYLAEKHGGIDKIWCNGSS